VLSADPKRQENDAERVLHEAENCVFALRGMAISNRILEISREAASAQASGDTAAVEELNFEQLELEKIRRQLAQNSVPV